MWTLYPKSRSSILQIPAGTDDICGLRAAYENAPAQIQELTPHREFFVPGGDVIFVVEKILYRVHAFFFSRHSPVFSKLLGADEGPTMMSKDSYIQLPGVHTAEFECFLSVIYAPQLSIIPTRSETELRYLLAFASTFGFASVVSTALAGLSPYLSKIEKIMLGDELHIPELTHEGYREICTHPTLPTLEEGRQLGLENIMCITGLRDHTHCFAPGKSATLTEELLEARLALRLGITSRGDGEGTVPPTPSTSSAPGQKSGADGPSASASGAPIPGQSAADKKSKTAAKEKGGKGGADDATHANGAAGSSAKPRKGGGNSGAERDAGRESQS